MLSVVRRVATRELSSCMDLAESQGWGRAEFNWNILAQIAEIFGIDNDDGKLVGCVALSRFAVHSAPMKQVTTVGMLLVAPTNEGRGLGRTLMEYALQHVGDATVRLYATPQGRPLYEKLGFATTGHVLRHCGHYTSNNLFSQRGEIKKVRNVSSKDVTSIARRDSNVFGMDRSTLIAALAQQAERIAVTDDRSAYAIAWRDEGTLHIGPLLAPDVSTAIALVDSVAEGMVRIDIPSQFAELSQLLRIRGLTPQVRDPLMVLGPSVAAVHLPHAIMMQSVG